MYNKDEIKLLKKYYPIIGIKVQQFLPERSKDSIDHMVRKLNVKYGLFEDGEEAYCDIETTNLNADFAFLLSYCFKVKGKNEYYCNKITSKEIRDGILDKRLCEDFVKDLLRFKKIYTYYGTRFDLPFMRTRALTNKIGFPPYGLIQHMDLYFLARNKLKLSRNRLDNVCRLLDIEGKTHLNGKIWMMAATGNEESINYILEHNKSDVMILEKAHEKLKVYASVTRSSI